MPPKKPGIFDERPFAPSLAQCPQCGHWMDALRFESHRSKCNIDPVARVEIEKQMERARQDAARRATEEEHRQQTERMQLRREHERLERERIDERLRIAAQDKAQAEEELANERWMVSVLCLKRDPTIVVVAFEQVSPDGRHAVRSWSRTDSVSDWRFGQSFPITEARTFERYTRLQHFEVDGFGRVTLEQPHRLDSLVSVPHQESR